MLFKKRRQIFHLQVDLLKFCHGSITNPYFLCTLGNSLYSNSTSQRVSWDCAVCQDCDGRKHLKIRLKEINPGNFSLGQNLRNITAAQQPDLVGTSSRRSFHSHGYLPSLQGCYPFSLCINSHTFL